MIATPAIVDVPLRADEDGVIRVGQTRVTPLSIVQRYLAGDTPEVIQASFPTISLGDVYAIIAYYLAHRDEIDQYIQQIVRDAEVIRSRFDSLPGRTTMTRDTLLARKERNRQKRE